MFSKDNFYVESTQYYINKNDTFHILIKKCI